MGEVYRARDVHLGRDVAIKVLPESVSSQREPLARFENEARLASSLNHPNIVTIHAIGREGDRRYIVMEYIDGPTLQAMIESGPMPLDSALNVAAQIADGLAKAHEAGIVHRDLKPKNVMLTRDGIAKILDFGASKLARSVVDPEAPTGILLRENEGMTEPGVILGTVEYMSPEQAAGRQVDFRSDQFSLGSLIYAILTGKRPFHRDTPVQTLSQIIETEPTPVTHLNPNVPRSVQAVIERCLMKDPQKRYDSTVELSETLHQLKEPRRSRPIRWTRREWIRFSAVAGILVTAGAGFWIWEDQPYQPAEPALDWYQKGVEALHSMTFEAARKALERAVAADPKFALAHASLARAYDELDYSERAKDAMLRAVTAAQETRLRKADETRLRALQFMISRDYDRAAPLFQELENDASDRDKPSAALESGWLAEHREDTDRAAAAYERAIKMNSSYAAAQLRLGFIQARRGQNDAALKSFTEAETLYSADSDYEGVTETLFQRATFLNRRSRPAEAMPEIEKALGIATTVGNTYQLIRLQLLQSAALRNSGEISRASSLAQQAIDLAITERMDNLATSGLLAFGNSFLARGDFESAEPNFRRALQLAQRGKVRRYEALVSLALGSLFEQRNRPEEAKRFIEGGLPFFRQAGYRRELLQSMTVLGGVLHQLAEFDEGSKMLREALPIATALQDKQSEVRVRERLVEIFREQGDWPRALQESEQTANMLGSAMYVRVQSAGLYWRLGRREDARRSLSAVEQMLKASEDQQLAPALKLGQAEIAYSDGRFAEARELARLISSAASDEVQLLGQLIDALVAIRTRRGTEGGSSARRIIGAFEQAGLIGHAAAARLATAEAAASAADVELARSMAESALGFFEARRIWESVWRAHAVAARFSQSPKEAETHRASARSALAELRKLWPAPAVDAYLSRPDIKSLSSSIGL